MGGNRSAPQQPYYVERDGQWVPYQPTFFERLILQGMRSELRRPPQDFGSALPHAPAPIIEPVAAIRRAATLDTKTFRLAIPSEECPAYLMKFSVSTTMPLRVMLHHKATVNVQGDIERCETSQTLLVLENSATNAEVVAPMLSEEEMAHASDLAPHEFSFVIELITENQSELSKVFVSRTQDSYAAVLVEQALRVGGHCYQLKSLYGTDGDDALDGASGKCIICWAAERDTAVLPCRHLCMCRACAMQLRDWSRKCPICRGSIQGLLHIDHQDGPL